ncbi:hypothetical protein BY996DRAFT_6598791 [Phakopsora pachyrhizi]|nr:hypothetical protein BY996DRAFT_6598791 [Phakopsora pachyrhizi]
MNNQEKVLEDTDLSASNPKIICFSGKHFSFFAYGAKGSDQSKGMPVDGAYIWFRKQTRLFQVGCNSRRETISVLGIHSRDSPKQTMKQKKDPVGTLLLKLWKGAGFESAHWSLKTVKLLPEPNCSQRTKEARPSINVYEKVLFESKDRDQYLQGSGHEGRKTNPDCDSPYLIHHLSMTRIPDYLMDSVINQVLARDLSAEQQDMNRPSRLEQKRQLYLIKLKLGCLGLVIRALMEKMTIKREMMIAHSLYSKISYKTAFSVRPMEYISNLYNRDLPDINDPKTIRDTTKTIGSRDVESTVQGDPIGAAKEGQVGTVDIRGNLTRRVRPIGPRIDMPYEPSEVMEDLSLIKICKSKNI